jgi:hypothetical protein
MVYYILYYGKVNNIYYLNVTRRRLAKTILHINANKTKHLAYPNKHKYNLMTNKLKSKKFKIDI